MSDRHARNGHGADGQAFAAGGGTGEPLFACIGGTAAYDLLQAGALVAERLGAQRTPFGESQPIFLCKVPGGSFYFLSRHGETGYELAPSFVNYRANVWALRSLGVRSIVSWSETRAITHNFKIGDYVLVDDLIDETRARPSTFFEQQGIGRVRQWPLFCPTLRTALISALSDEFCNFDDRGTYVCVEGPRQETAAETRKYESFGGELIGQTLAPEVFLAKELQMCYASICYVACYAEHGSNYRPFEAGRVLSVEVERGRAQKAIERLPRLLARLCQNLVRTPVACGCEHSMEQHINCGQIGPDWRTWFDFDVSAPSAAARSTSGG
jgi:5'-methylthioadenosine phosphorylase